MTTPPPAYPSADGSQLRAKSMALVIAEAARRAVENGKGVSVVQAIVYLDGDEPVISPFGVSHIEAAQNSKYSALPGVASSSLSRNDAEVHTLDWTYTYLSNEKAKGRKPRNIIIDLQGDKGSCNACKIRQDLFRADLNALFPEAASVLNVNYANPGSRQIPAVLGRNVGDVYGDPLAQQRESSYLRDTDPDNPARFYYQSRNSPAGPVWPKALQFMALPQGSPRSDSGSPRPKSPTEPRSLEIRKELQEAFERLKEAQAEENKRRQIFKAVKAQKSNALEALRQYRAQEISKLLASQAYLTLKGQGFDMTSLLKVATQTVDNSPAMQRAEPRIAQVQLRLEAAQAAHGRASQTFIEITNHIRRLTAEHSHLATSNRAPGQHEETAQAASGHDSRDYSVRPSPSGRGRAAL
ncbi:hypothetical protein ACH4C6_35345 [Streptomyces sp. NPDC017943]|uniref:hypothetical protein n=1 Tax=Streptomyces sp. NPDC017943 TaxID=3365019 RepID=UPI0037A85D4E